MQCCMTFVRHCCLFHFIQLNGVGESNCRLTFEFQEKHILLSSSLFKCGLVCGGENPRLLRVTELLLV